MLAATLGLGCAGASESEWLGDEPRETEPPASTYAYERVPPPERDLSFAKSLPEAGRYAVLQRRWTDSQWGIETYRVSPRCLARPRIFSTTSI